MPFEIVFNKKPNVGIKKQFVDVDDSGLEKQATLDGLILTESEPILDILPETDENSNEANGLDSNQEQLEEEIELETIILSKRAQFNKNKEINAVKMINKHDHRRNKKTIEFNIGDLITVKIPRIDRGGTEFP